MFLKSQLKKLLDGAITDHGTTGEGMYQGYYIAMHNTQKGVSVFVSAHSDNDPGNGQLAAFLKNRVQGCKNLSGFVTEQTGFSFFANGFTSGAIAKAIDAFVAEAVRWMASCGYVSGCSSCGRTDVVRAYLVNGESKYLCPSCINEIVQALEANKQEKKRSSSNLLTGLVGAFLGALIGCVLYVVIAQLGYIAGISGLVMSVLALRLYEKMGGALDVKGIIVTFLLLIGMIWIANQITWALAIWLELKDYGWSFAECYQNLGMILEQAELQGSYFSDLAAGYLFTFVGSIGTFISALKGSTGSYSIKEL